MTNKQWRAVCYAVAGLITILSPPQGLPIIFFFAAIQFVEDIG